MSNGLKVVPSQPCDDLLDFIYGGLSPAKQKAFEEHLETCTNNCKAEVAATQKLRAYTKEALPPVEPSNDRMAAISAQLLHAAAQRKTGKVVPLFRRIITHPGFSAAAAMLVVGLYVTTQWGNLKMPAKEAAPATATQPAPTAAPSAAAPKPTLAKKEEQAPAAELPTEDPAAPSEPLANADRKESASKASADKAPSRELAKSDAKPTESKRMGAEAEKSKELFQTRKDVPTDDELWQRKSEPQKPVVTTPTPKLDGTIGGDSYANANGTAAKKKSKSGSYDAGLFDSNVTAPSSANAPAGVASGEGSVGGKGGGGYFASGAAKPASSPPAAAPAPPPQKMAKTEERDARGSVSNESLQYSLNNKQAAAPTTPSPEPAPMMKAPAQQAAQPPTATSTPRTQVATNDEPRSRNNDAKNEQGNFSNLGRQATQADSLRRRGETLARSGKCEDAMKSFNEANRTAPNSDHHAADQLSYAKCLREQGRYDAAQMALDSLQRQNVESNQGAVENEVNLLNTQRRQYGAPSPTSKAKAAPRRAAPASEKAVDAATNN